MTNKTKFIILVIVAIAISTAFFLLYYMEAFQAPSEPVEEPSYTFEGKRIEMPTGKPEPAESDLIAQISGITYKYEDEFMPGKPQTYTFFNSGILIIAFWEDTGNGIIKTGEEQCTFNLWSDNETLRIHWPDGTNDTCTFAVQSHGREIVINDTVYTKTDLMVGEVD